MSLLPLLIAAAACGQPPASSAARAAELYEEGKRSLGRGEAAAALVALEAAYGLVQNDPIRFYLGLAYAGVGRCGEAIPLLVAVEGKVPRRLSAERARTLTRCRLVEGRSLADVGDCAAAMSHLEALADIEPAPPGVTTLIRGCRSVQHAERAARAGQPRTALAHLDGALLARPGWRAILARRAALEASLEEPSLVGTPAPRADARHTWGWALTGLGGGAIAASVVLFAVAAGVQEGVYDPERDGDLVLRMTHTEADAELARSDAMNTSGLALVSVGAAALGVGVWLLLASDDPEQELSTTIAPEVTLGAEGGWIGLRGGF